MLQGRLDLGRRASIGKLSVLFDGGLATVSSSTELAVSRASAGPISSGSEESKHVRLYAACERYGFESFGRISN